MNRARLKILVVDSEVKTMKFLSSILEKANYLVMPATNVATAFSWLHQMSPDLVIVEPELTNCNGDGISLCRSLKKSPETRKIPIIALSRRPTEKLRIKVAICRTELHLTKPVKSAILLQAIKKLLGTRKDVSGRRTVLRRGQLEVDPDSRSVFFNGKTIYIGRKLFDVLYILAKQWPNTVHHRHILSSICATNRDKEVCVWISRLRSKLHQVSGHRLIQCVPRQGYRIVFPSNFNTQHMVAH